MRHRSPSRLPASCHPCTGIPAGPWRRSPAPWPRGWPSLFRTIQTHLQVRLRRSFTAPGHTQCNLIENASLLCRKHTEVRQPGYKADLPVIQTAAPLYEFGACVAPCADRGSAIRRPVRLRWWRPFGQKFRPSCAHLAPDHVRSARSGERFAIVFRAKHSHTRASLSRGTTAFMARPHRRSHRGGGVRWVTDELPRPGSRRPPSQW